MSGAIVFWNETLRVTESETEETLDARVTRPRISIRGVQVIIERRFSKTATGTLRLLGSLSDQVRLPRDKAFSRFRIPSSGVRERLADERLSETIKNPVRIARPAGVLRTRSQGRIGPDRAEIRVLHRSCPGTARSCKRSRKS